MNASSWQNLSAALIANENVTRTRVELRGALDGVTDTGWLRRTNATCIWGVSDPLPTGPGTGSGGWQRGSLTPQMRPPLLPNSCADCDTGGKQRRPIDSREVAEHKEHHHFTRCRNNVPLVAR